MLALLGGNKAGGSPAFSGLIHVTAGGLEREGLRLPEAHHDAARLARAAASSHRAGGFPSAVLPLDMCVEAEALGSRVDFRAGERAEYPRVEAFLYESVEEFNTKDTKGAKVKHRGRIPLVCNAIDRLKEDVGKEAVLGGYLPGPFTLLSLLVETGALYQALRRQPGAVRAALESLADALAAVGAAYRAAGADFLTVHEMGGSPGALGPKAFEAVVLPHLQALFTALPHPAVLSCCGRTNGAMRLLAASGAAALSVDQTNDLAASREEVPGATLFGNLDPVGILALGTPGDVRQAAEAARGAGADAVWPGCDLHPGTPLENLRALGEA